MRTHQSRKATPETQFQQMNSDHIIHLAVLAFCRGKKRDQALTQCSSSSLRLLLGEPEGYEIKSVNILPGKLESELVLRINRKRDLLFPNIHSRTRASEWLQPYITEEPYKVDSIQQPPVSVYFVLQDEVIGNQKKTGEQPETGEYKEKTGEQPGAIAYNQKWVGQDEEPLMHSKAVGHNEKWVGGDERTVVQPKNLEQQQSLLGVVVPATITVSRVQLLKVLETYLASAPLKKQLQPVIEYYLALCKSNLKKEEYLDHQADRWPDSAWFAFFQELQQQLGNTWTQFFLPVQGDATNRIAPVYRMDSIIDRFYRKPFEVCLVFYPEIQAGGFLEYKVLPSTGWQKSEDRELLQKYTLREGEKFLLPFHRKEWRMGKKGLEEDTGAFRLLSEKGGIELAATVTHLQILLSLKIASYRADNSYKPNPSYEQAFAYLYQELFRQLFEGPDLKKEKDLSYARSLVRLCLKEGQDYDIRSLKVLRVNIDADLWIEVNEELVLVFIFEPYRYRGSRLQQKVRNYTRQHGTKIVLVQYEIMDSSQIEEVPEVQIVKRHQVISLLESYLATTPNAEQHLLLVHHQKELLKVEEGLNSYRILPFAEWGSLAWNGFFRDLQLQLGGYRDAFYSKYNDLSWKSQEYLFKFYKGKRLVHKFSFFLNLTNDGQHSIILSGLVRHIWVWRPYLWKHLERERLRVDSIPATFESSDWGDAKIMGDFRRTNGKGELDMEATVAYLRSWVDFMRGLRDSVCADPMEGFTVTTSEEPLKFYR